jgi:LacI family transcriptional regulator
MDTQSGNALPRIPDIARIAGVSTATVDRVLNARGNVRPMTVERVLKAAAALGYIGDADHHPARGGKPMRIVFLLPAGNNRFLIMLGRLIANAQDHLTGFNVRVRVEHIKSFSPELLARRLRQVGGEADGIAFFAIEHPAVREAVNGLADAGIPTVTLISDVAQSSRAAYIGLDNRSAGRTAGYLIGRFVGARPGKVAMIAGSRSYRAHEEREMGFLHLFEQTFPALKVIDLREGHDDAAKNYRLAKTLLAQHPDIVGIYNIGGAPEGIARALKEAGRDQTIVFVGHGLNAETRALLVDGAMDAVITQNPQETLMACVGVFSNLRAGRPAMADIPPVRSEIILRDNLP